MVLSIVGGLAVAGAYYWNSQGEKTAAKLERAREREAERALAHEAITLTTFGRIEPGMAYDDVVAVVGRSGEQTSMTVIMGMTYTSYSWKTDVCCGNMSLQFKDGVLTSKAQFGLK